MLLSICSIRNVTQALNGAQKFLFNNLFGIVVWFGSKKEMYEEELLKR